MRSSPMVSPTGLQLGDCLAGMASLPPRSVDLVLADPPYSPYVHTHGRRGTASGSGRRRPAPGQLAQVRPLAFEPLTTELRDLAATQFARLARRWVLVFSDVESDHLWRNALVLAGLEYVRTMFWHRRGAAPQFSGDRPAQACEAIVLAHPKGTKRWNGGGKQGFYDAPVVRRGRIHPAQKPLALIEDLVRDFSDPSALVLDPFAGSATTAVACHRLNRRFLGWEASPVYYSSAQQRLSEKAETPRGGDHLVAAS